MKTSSQKWKLWRLIKVLYFIISAPILLAAATLAYIGSEVARGENTVVNYFWFFAWIIIIIISYIIISDLLKRICNYVSYGRFNWFIKTTKEHTSSWFAIVITLTFLLILSHNFKDYCSEKWEFINKNGDCECSVGFEKNKNNTCSINTEWKIIEKIPSWAFLREFKNVPWEDDTYIWVYINNYKVNPISEENPPYTDCFWEVEWNSIEWEYHIFTFENNKITSDMLVPGLMENYNPIFAFPYKNTKINNFQYFGWEKPKNEIENYNIEYTNLITFRDFNGDWLKQEFSLINHWDQVCWHNNYLIVGFDAKNRSAVFYWIRDKNNNLNFWWDNFIPDNKWNAITGWDCWDHGSATETKNNFTFNKEKKEYILTNSTTQECPEWTF